MKINRRRFISIGSAVIASLASLPLLTGSGYSGLKRSDIENNSDAESLKIKLGDERYTMLYLASLAPSPHNTQPWYVKIITNDSWIICADQSRQMKATDPYNLRLILALGAFIENLTVAAGSMGYEAEIKVLTNDFFADDIAAVNLKKSEKKTYSLELLKSRKTLKKGYLNKVIDNKDIMQLQETLKNHFFYFPRDTWHSECIRDGSIEAFQTWLDSKEAQDENVAWMRVSNKKAKRMRDGLTTEGMEIKGPVGFFVRTFFSDQDFSGNFMMEESMKFTRTIAHEGAGYAIITGYGRTVAGMIETGRRYERMALLACKLNIGIQPMTQMLEMKKGLDVIGAEHSRKIDPQMILRIGYVKDYPAPVSLRRPVSWFVRGA